MNIAKLLKEREQVMHAHTYFVDCKPPLATRIATKYAQYAKHGQLHSLTASFSPQEGSYVIPLPPLTHH